MSKDPKFELASNFEPMGDQPAAIAKLIDGIKAKQQHQILLGATGTGKTFTMANIINELQRPTLVLAHNKTLAAQLCSEFQGFFPNNAVSYFVSYYDYYQPEAYLPSTDTYIEKDASINDEINKYRHAATHNLLTRRDVLIVASVSCIYGLGDVSDYEALAITLKRGDAMQRDKLLRQLTDIQYTRSGLEFRQSQFHVLGDTVEIFPPGGDTVFRVEMPFDEIETIQEVDSFTGELITDLNEVVIFPAAHNVTTKEKIENAIDGIKAELEQREAELKQAGELAKAERIRTRTEYDIEMLLETGYCTGIENYMRFLSNNGEPNRPPSTLLDYFPDDFLMFIDESHISVPQIGGMYEGNRSRKQNLVEYGFRLPSAHDNRPLKFEEFEDRVGQTVYVSATPGKYEYKHTDKQHIAEQIIRPTGLLDPVVRVKSGEHQIDDITKEIQATMKRKERVLVTTLTKKSAEQLDEYLRDQGYNVRYLHSDIDTMERIEILRQLRTGEIDIVVGINLLREGLDLPEVSFIAILDADKQGFLRSRDALIQTIGRAARNVNGHVTLYARPYTRQQMLEALKEQYDESLPEEEREPAMKAAEKLDDEQLGALIEKPDWVEHVTPVTVTQAMENAIEETNRRREIQQEYNEKHNITPQTIMKAVHDIAEAEKSLELRRPKRDHQKIPKDEKKRLVEDMEQQMALAAQNYEFERAADLRDEIELLKKEL